MSDKVFRLTTTQVGAIGEALIACDLMIASGGRLTPFKPLADDDGIDLLLYDKATRVARPIQVKCRTKFDNIAAQTLQFDSQLTTFSENGEGFLLAAHLEGRHVQTTWLVPSQILARQARTTSNKLTMVASAKPTSKDRYAPYRHASMTSVAHALVAYFDAAAGRSLLASHAI